MYKMTNQQSMQFIIPMKKDIKTFLQNQSDVGMTMYKSKGTRYPYHFL